MEIMAAMEAGPIIALDMPSITAWFPKLNIPTLLQSTIAAILAGEDSNHMDTPV